MRHAAKISSIALVATLAIGGLAIHKAAADSRPSVFSTLSDDPRFGTTIKMVYVAGASQRLSTAGDLTVFAATDDGWNNSSATGMLSSLSSTGAGSEFPDSMGILQVLRGFFVHGEAPANAPAVTTFESAAGRQIQLDKNAMKVTWVTAEGQTKSAPVGKPIEASNGVIYPVDAVVGE